MNQIRPAVATMLCVTALAVAACSQPEGGTPSPTSAVPATASQDPGRPVVRNPKNLEAVSDPCQLLKPGQLQQLGTSGANSHRPSAWGEDTCTWGVDTDGVQVHIAPSVTTNYGLSSVLQTTGKPAPDEEVDGYPMVTSDSATFTCGIYVAANSEDVFGVTVDRGASDRPDTCAVAKRVASMVLSNLPAKN